MNKALWIARKNYLATLIKKVSDGHGGDERQFLIAHFDELLKAHPNEKIEQAIRCYEEMIGQLCPFTRVYESPLPEDKGIKFIKPFITYAESSLGKNYDCK